jgi:hypothetical protein
MGAHDWYVENRWAYVTRTLESREERLFADHVAGCEECARDVARLERDVAWLPMGVRPVVPRPGFVRWLAEQVLRGTPRWRRLAPPIGAAALVLLASGVALQEHTRQAELEAFLADREKRLSALMDTLSVMRDAHRVIQEDIAMEGRRGGLVIFQDVTSHRWNVVVYGLPPAPAGSVYQFWLITKTGMVRSVELRLESNRPAFATMAMPKAPGPVMGAALTVEPATSRAQEPSGPELAHIEF